MLLPDDICLHFNLQSKEIPEITINRYCLELMHYLIAYPGHESRVHCNILSKDKMVNARKHGCHKSYGMEHRYRDNFSLYFLCTISTVIRT
jgi:hypothetical protein